MDDHADAVADEQDIDMGIEQGGHRIGIGCQADDFLAAFQRPDIWYGDPPGAPLFRHFTNPPGACVSGFAAGDNLGRAGLPKTAAGWMMRAWLSPPAATAKLAPR